ncbi:hypothetical protein D3C73_1010880 [compost metagenome]
MIEGGRQASHLFSGGRDPGLPFDIGEADQGVLLGHIDAAVDIGQAIGRVETVDEDRADFGAAVVIGVAQQRDTVPAFDLRVALLLDDPCDDVLRPQGRSAAAPPLGHEDVAVGQDQHLTRNTQVRSEGRHHEAFGGARRLISPSYRPGDTHRRQQGFPDLRQVRRRPDFVDPFFASTAGGQSNGAGQGPVQKEVGADHRPASSSSIPE